MKTPSDIPAIILAGGQGTRLRSVVADVPKPMAPILDLPFLHYIFLFLKKNNVKKVVLAVGYKHEIIQDFFKDNYEGIAISYSIEDEPLGTGGAILKAFDCVENDAFLINGDTFFNIDLAKIAVAYSTQNCKMAIALKPMQKFDRYGIVNMDENQFVTSFEEKKYCENGLINAGVYLTNKQIFSYIFKENIPQKFSFEKEILENKKLTNQLTGLVFDNYFIDIGIPEDYAAAQISFKNFDSLS